MFLVSATASDGDSAARGPSSGRLHVVEDHGIIEAKVNRRI